MLQQTASRRTRLTIRRDREGIRTCFLEGSVWRKGGCLSRKNHNYLFYKLKWDLDCSQKRLPIKLKNRHGGGQGLNKLDFQPNLSSGFPVHLKTHFRLLEPIIDGRPPAHIASGSERT